MGSLDSDIDGYEEDSGFYEASLFKNQVSAQLLTHHCFALYTVVVIVLHCALSVLQTLGDFFGSDLLSVCEVFFQVKMDTPVHIGFVILQYAKLRMLEFYYDFMDR